MQNELSTDFKEVTVEWVQQCPNLTQKPFYLTSPGKKSTVRLYFPSTKKCNVHLQDYAAIQLFWISVVSQTFFHSRKEARYFTLKSY